MPNPHGIMLIGQHGADVLNHLEDVYRAYPQASRDEVPDFSGMGDTQTTPGWPWQMDNSDAGGDDEDGSSPTVPAYGCMAIKDVNKDIPVVDQKLCLKTAQASDTFYSDYAVNFPVDANADGKAISRCGVPGDIVRVLYDGDDPSPGDELGPVSGQWYVKAGYPSICTVIGVVDSDNKIALGRLHPIGDILFEIKTDKVPGSSSDAYPLKSDGTADTSATTFKVYDLTGGKQWRAWGKDTISAGGARGTARYNYISQHLEIVQMMEVARMIGGAATVDGSKNLTGVGSLYSMDKGQLPSPTSLTASSTPPVAVSGWTTNSGADVTMLWNEQSAGYKPIDAVCKT